MKRYILFCALFFLLFLSSAFALEYHDVERDYKLKFPRDFYYREDYRVQWWYFTGHLYDEKGREFGYELTFFVAGVQKRPYKSRFGVNNIYISHFAVSDVDEKKYYYSDKADSGAFDFAGAKADKLSVWVVDNRMDGSMDEIHIKAFDTGKTVDLLLTPAKPLVLNGENGYSRKSEESPYIASLYFSYTRMKTEGSLKIGDKVFKVSGNSWFDRELSSRGLGGKQAGWDWFAVQLDDNREIMLYHIRNKDGSIDRYSSGTVVGSDGIYRHLSARDFKITTLKNYRSGKTGARYPAQWEISIPSENLALKITPLMEDQEFLAADSTGNYYWEGTCKVEGPAKGRAYVEMTGY